MKGSGEADAGLDSLALLFRSASTSREKSTEHLKNVCTCNYDIWSSRRERWAQQQRKGTAVITGPASLTKCESVIVVLSHARRRPRREMKRNEPKRSARRRKSESKTRRDRQNSAIGCQRTQEPARSRNKKRIERDFTFNDVSKFVPPLRASRSFRPSPALRSLSVFLILCAFIFSFRTTYFSHSTKTARSLAALALRRSVRLSTLGSVFIALAV